MGENFAARYRYKTDGNACSIVPVGTLGKDEQETMNGELHHIYKLIAKKQTGDATKPLTIYSKTPATAQTMAQFVARAWRFLKKHKTDGCTCEIETVFFDAKIGFANMEKCPIHGFGDGV